jgi:hypothetical protein
MFRFGVQALTQFKGRIGEWPQYCSHILQIAHLRATHPDLVAYIERVVEEHAAGTSVGTAAGTGADTATTTLAATATAGHAPLAPTPVVAAPPAQAAATAPTAAVPAALVSPTLAATPSTASAAANAARPSSANPLRGACEAHAEDRRAAQSSLFVLTCGCGGAGRLLQRRLRRMEHGRR